jgi:hypothetical protein
MDQFRPQHVTVPAPRRSVYARGRYSDKKQAPNRSIRIPDDEYKAIQEAAELLEMTLADFARWMMYYGALEIKNQHSLQGFQDRHDNKSEGLDGFE